MLRAGVAVRGVVAVRSRGGRGSTRGHALRFEAVEAEVAAEVDRRVDAHGVEWGPGRVGDAVHHLEVRAHRSRVHHGRSIGNGTQGFARGRDGFGTTGVDCVDERDEFASVANAEIGLCIERARIVGEGRDVDVDRLNEAAQTEQQAVGGRSIETLIVERGAGGDEFDLHSIERFAGPLQVADDRLGR